MKAFPDLKTATNFPYPESTHFEFKCSFTALDANTKRKLEETICAFLNTEGGYLIIGIHDTTREILGVHENKELDRFLLRVDNIYHSNSIVHDDGSTLTPGTVKAMSVPAGEKTICFVQATPQPGKKYRLNSGEMYYRLSASNFRLMANTDVMTLRTWELHNHVMNKMRPIQEDFQKLVKHTLTLEQKIQDMKEEVKKAQEKEQASLQLLFDHILQKKQAKEQEFKNNVKGDIDMRALCCLLT